MRRKLKVLYFMLFVGFNLIAQNDYHSSIRVEKMLHTDTTTVGQGLDFQQLKCNEVEMSKVVIPPGDSTKWHKHLRPVFASILQGTLTVKYDNGRKNHFQTGDSFAEAIDMYHNGINTGKVDLIILAVYITQKGEPLTIMKEN